MKPILKCNSCDSVQPRFLRLAEGARSMGLPTAPRQERNSVRLPQPHTAFMDSAVSASSGVLFRIRSVTLRVCSPRNDDKRDFYVLFFNKCIFCLPMNAYTFTA